ncbi:MAG: pantoate--beta-alanine ligase [Myxococcota bacterium]
MLTVDSIRDFRDARAALEGTVAFVPTMGFLHEGHLSLMEAANRHADHLVVSIYVNPTQFAPGEDLEDYPRDPEGDAAKCEELGTSILFMPSDELMYADDHSTTVRVDQLDEVLCATSRPTHFPGVTTIVTKLFNIVQPDVAVFGEKDYQQLAIIRRMVRDLNVPVDIVGSPTVREEDGVAMSSRNKYLTDRQREDARCLSQGLKLAWRAYHDGERDGEALVKLVRSRLEQDVEADQVDYVECVHPTTLERYSGANRQIDPAEGVVVAVAVQMGQARLIDNLPLDRPLPNSLM